MKKAKFNDNFKLIAGACIGHFCQEDKTCHNCKLIQLCADRTEKGIYPKSQKEVKQIINQYFKK